MTNRQYIEQNKRLPSPFVHKLSWLFDNRLDIDKTPIIIKQVNNYGRDWRGGGDCNGVYIDTDAWEFITTNSLFQLLAHELTHVYCCRTKGWIKWSVELLITICRSIKKGKFYDHSVSNEEAEAEANRKKWFDKYWPSRYEWENLLNEQVSNA